MQQAPTDSASAMQVPAKQLPDGHVVPSALSVAPAHTPVAGLHVPGLRQGPTFCTAVNAADNAQVCRVQNNGHRRLEHQRALTAISVC
jgi:hypothetical protein